MSNGNAIDVASYVPEGALVDEKKRVKLWAKVTVHGPSGLVIDRSISSRNPATGTQVDTFTPISGSIAAGKKTFETILKTQAKTPNVVISFRGVTSGPHNLLPAVYRNEFRCTVYYTPREAGFTAARGFNVTPVPISIEGTTHNCKSDFIEAIKTEGIGRLENPVTVRRKQGGRNVDVTLNYVKTDNVGRTFAALPFPVGQANIPLVPKVSCAVSRSPRVIPFKATIRVVDDYIYSKFENSIFQVHDTGGLDQYQIDLYWGEDDPRAPGRRGILRPLGTDFTENEGTTLFLDDYPE